MHHFHDFINDRTVLGAKIMNVLNEITEHRLQL